MCIDTDGTGICPGVVAPHRGPPLTRGGKRPLLARRRRISGASGDLSPAMDEYGHELNITLRPHWLLSKHAPAVSVVVHECAPLTDKEFAEYKEYLVRFWRRRQKESGIGSRRELETWMETHPLRKIHIKDMVDGPLTESQLVSALRGRPPPVPGTRPDIEFVSVRCIDRLVSAACGRADADTGPSSPRLGTVTFWPQVLLGVHFGMWVSVLRAAAAAKGCLAHWRSDRLAVLGIELPTYLPSVGVHAWSDRAAPLFERLTVSHLQDHDAWDDGSAEMVPRRRLFTVPYGSNAGAWADPIQQPSPIGSVTERPYLAAFLGYADATNPLRLQLHRECTAASSGTCIRGGRGPPSSSWWGWTSWPWSTERPGMTNLSAYALARFCLQPWGDTATRRGFYDALSYGCIPVIFDEAGYGDLGRWFGHPRAYSLLLPYRNLRRTSNVSVLERLRRLPAARVAALAEGVRHARSRMLYRRTSQLQHTRPRGQEEASPILEDASDVIVGSLGRMWSRKHDRS